MAVDQRRPDRIALLFNAYSAACRHDPQAVTLTSADGGSTWQRRPDVCGGARYERLAIAPNGNLLRWSNYDPAVTPQVLDSWR